MDTLVARMTVNGMSIELNPFTEQLLARTTAGLVSALRGADEWHNLELHLEQRDLRILVNGEELTLTPFPSEVITNTVIALASSLKGVDRIDSLEINVRTGQN